MVAPIVGGTKASYISDALLLEIRAEDISYLEELYVSAVDEK